MDVIGLIGILLGLALMIWLAFRGWSVLLLAPLAALVAALFGGEPLLAHWTQTFMGAAGAFLGQFFPLFLLGAVFGKVMEDSGAVTATQAVRLGGRVPVPLVGPEWAVARRVAALAGAPVPDHLLELVHRGRAADTGLANEVLGVDAPRGSTVDVVKALYEWATVTRLVPSERAA